MTLAIQRARTASIQQEQPQVLQGFHTWCTELVAGCEKTIGLAFLHIDESLQQCENAPHHPVPVQDETVAFAGQCGAFSICRIRHHRSSCVKHSHQATRFPRCMSSGCRSLVIPSPAASTAVTGLDSRSRRRLRRVFHQSRSGTFRRSIPDGARPTSAAVARTSSIGLQSAVAVSAWPFVTTPNASLVSRKFSLGIVGFLL